MCGRFVLASKDKIKNKYNYSIEPNYNISPNNNILVLDESLMPKKLKWGFSPSWAKKPFNIINARIETLYEKLFFKNSFKCIILADGYYEWKKENSFKQPYYHYLKDDFLYFAGIYNNSSGCCIVTKESNENISHIHNRQPLIIYEQYIENWIKNKYDPTFCNNKKLNYHKVSLDVNIPNNNYKTNIIIKDY